MELDKINKATEKMDEILNNISINFTKLLLQDDDTTQYEYTINNNFDAMIQRVNDRRRDLLTRLQNMKQARLAIKEDDLNTQQKKQKIRDELIVYGYIRTTFMSSQSDDIIQLCLAYYLHFADKWNIKKSWRGFDIDINKNILKYPGDPKDQYGSSWEHALGSMVIRKGDIQHWTLKIFNCDGVAAIHFGIIPYDKTFSNINRYFFTQQQIAGYNGFYSFGFKVDQNEKDWKLIKPDMDWRKRFSKCIMTLDMRQTGNGNNKKYGKLWYTINDKSHKVEFDHIDMDKEYVMICAISRPTDELQLS